MGPWVHGFMGVRAHDLMTSWSHGFMSPRVHGFTGARVRGFMGSWVHGLMGSWVHALHPYIHTGTHVYRAQERGLRKHSASPHEYFRKSSRELKTPSSVCAVHHHRGIISTCSVAPLQPIVSLLIAKHAHGCRERYSPLERLCWINQRRNCCMSFRNLW